MSKKVSVIITTRDRADVLETCLASIEASTVKPHEIIVIDNASQDNTCEMIEAKYPSTTIIRRESNLFLAGARNLGMDNASGEYLLIIDDDNEIDSHMIEELVNLCATDPSIGIAGPKMYFYQTDRILNYAGAHISPISSRVYYRGSGEQDAGQFNEPIETSQIPNIMMITRAVYEKIGGFDNVYRQTFADADYPMRAKEAGFKVMYCPAAVTWHMSDPPGTTKSDGSNLLLFRSPMRAYYQSRNRFLYMRRFSRGLQYVIFMLVYAPLATLYYTLVCLRIARTSQFEHLRDLSAMKLHLLGSWHGALYGLGGKLRDYYDTHEAEPSIHSAESSTDVEKH